MDVADYRLCEELYLLSGWTGTSFYHDASEGYDEKHVEYSSDGSLPIDGGMYPAYTLGFILRKLAEETSVQMETVSHENELLWSITVSEGGYDGTLGSSAETPEKAAVKLAIELFKQKILVRKRSKV